MKNILLSGAAILLSSALFSQTYCNPNFTSCGSGNYLSNVTLAGIANNTSGCAVWDYTSQTASINAGATVPFSITCAGWDGIAIYADLNNDGDMTDAGEKLFSQYSASGPPTNYSDSISIPTGTSGGNHRLRVMCGNGGSVSGSTDPCLSVAWGNFHDYTLFVNNGCKNDSNLTVSNITSTSADITWAARNGVGFEYVFDTNATAPTGAGISTTALSYSATGLTNGQQYYFHVRTDCGSSAYSGWGRTDFVACDLPNATINMSGDVNGCLGDTVQLVVPPNSLYSFQWYRNGSKLTSATSNVIDVNLFGGDYFVKVELAQGCASLSDTATITFNPKPNAPVLTANGSKLTTGGYLIYVWYVDGSIIPGAVDSVHIATVNGSYRVVGTHANGCVVSSENVVLTNVGINDIDAEIDMRLYPNPFTGKMIVELDNAQEGTYKYSIIDALGNVVRRNAIEISQGRSQFEINNLDNVSKGVYLLKMTSPDGKISSTQIIKE